MGTKHTVYRATFTPTTIEIPDRCPECDADFHEVGSLIEGNWQDCTVRSHLSDPVSFKADHRALEAEGETDYGETYYPSGLLCANCDWSIGGDDA